MRSSTIVALLGGVLVTGVVQAKGDGSLQAPLTIPAGRPGPVTVNWGDFNGDGKLDLVVANGTASNVATGSPNILVLFQNPAARHDWKPFSLPVGASAVYVRGGDMDNDGFDDILVADTARSAFFVRSVGDGTFAKPVAIARSNGARWIAIADFNNDHKLDFASSNFGAANLTIFLGDGAGNFIWSQTHPGSREHTLDSLDFDGDGNMDLVMGSGLPGITPYKGDGKGKFVARPNVSNLGC
ncbi:MAG: FG-GAP repeat domain-containing protein, partial [Anaerolineales bacterium]